MPRKKNGGGRRRRGHDYSRGGYFITAITRKRRRLLGRVFGGKAIPSAIGAFVIETFFALSTHFANVESDTFACMPDHVHGMIWLKPQLRGQPRAKDLPDVMQRFKSLTSQRFFTLAPPRSGTLWQRGYYDIWVRNMTDLQRIKAYIRNNPKNWEPQIARWSDHGLDD